MGADAGFDMVPRLTRSKNDMEKWKKFIKTIQKNYDDDEQVKVHEHYIEFEAGEHPTLPFDGFKFLRFSSKVTGSIAARTSVWKYIECVTGIARLFFGGRARSWSELRDEYGFYDWLDVHHSRKSYNKVIAKSHSICFAIYPNQT